MLARVGIMRCPSLLVALLPPSVLAYHGGDGCAQEYRQMARLNYPLPVSQAQVDLLVCEDVRSPNGSVTFQLANGSSLAPFPLTLQKRVYPNYAAEGEKYLNWSKAEVLAAKTDLLGNWLLGVHGNPPRDEVTWDAVKKAMPPLRQFNGGRVWTANRESGRDAAFALDGTNHIGGTPDPSDAARYLPGLKSSFFNFEGLIGGSLPIPLLNFPVAPVNGEPTMFWEMSVVPVAEGTGFQQPVFIRFLQVNASAQAGRAAPGTLYFDTFAYQPSACATEDLAGCSPARGYFAAMLDVHFFWERTWEQENRMRLALPQRADTDGGLLTLQAEHSLVLDMITRSVGIWPRYGILPGYDQASIGSDGFQEILTASTMASLEWGLFGYAHDVLDNYWTYFVRGQGQVLYRGPELAQHGRMLTNMAQYVRYTGDETLILKHLDKIDGVRWLLAKRRDAALAAHPQNDSRHGMPTGNDEADLWWRTVKNGVGTELPFISIAAEMWRGFRDCGEVLARIAERTKRQDVGRVAAAMNSVAPKVKEDLKRSMAKDAQGSFPRCMPYAAGSQTCGVLADAPSNRDSEPWRTYAEAFYSGALESETMAEILVWHQTQQGDGVNGSRLKLGVLAGCGGDVTCTDQFMTFTLHGWGYGLLQADQIDAFLLQYFAVSAHGYTPGTWIAPESANIDRSVSSVAYCTPAQLTAPIYLKWMLAFEDPISHTLWLGKASPRVWLSQGEVWRIDEVPTAYGRISLLVASSIDSEGVIRANLTVPESWARGAGPPGGVRLRLRAPGGWRMASTKVGGNDWGGYRPSDETVVLQNSDFTDTKWLASLQSITVRYAGSGGPSQEEQTFV
eukprot:gb/GFBE01020791.1/.p1 GENE.gb/GFBE01020791.1/~~gb/GFBE01020791.1/.p1  ORF type:complete len:845 (+),score=132.62 gb/GFBE01020791.1/:1-2535(+)